MTRTALTVLLGLALAACATAPDPIAEIVIESEPAPVANVEPPSPAPEAPAAEPPVEPEPPASLPPAKPPQTDDGRWRVAVAAERTVEEAAKWAPRLAALGYRSETESVELDGTTWQRVVLPGYRTLRDARAMTPILNQELGIANAWVPAQRTGARAAQPPASPAPAEPAAAAEPLAPAKPATVSPQN